MRSAPNAVAVGTVDPFYGTWVRRFATDGGTLWTQEEPNAGFDAARGVAIGSEESVVVAGDTGIVPTLLDGWLRKYDSNGSEQWTYVFNSMGGSTSDTFQAVATGPNDEVACVGGAGAAGTLDVWVGSFSADGDLAWSDTQSTANGATRAEDVAIDGAGNVIVVATMPTPVQPRTVAWVRKYAPEGVVLWTQEFNVDDADVASTTIEGVAIDPQDGILVVGAYSTGADTDPWIRKIAP